jgi:hypothetical protein
MEHAVSLLRDELSSPKCAILESGSINGSARLPILGGLGSRLVFARFPHLKGLLSSLVIHPWISDSIHPFLLLGSARRWIASFLQIPDSRFRERGWLAETRRQVKQNHG